MAARAIAATAEAAVKMPGIMVGAFWGWTTDTPSPLDRAKILDHHISRRSRHQGLERL
jgi:hypothetical protein